MCDLVRSMRNNRETGLQTLAWKEEAEERTDAEYRKDELVETKETSGPSTRKITLKYYLETEREEREE